MKKSQPEALLEEGFHGRAALVGSLAFFFILVLNGGEQLKKLPCISRHLGYRSSTFQDVSAQDQLIKVFRWEEREDQST